MTITQKLMKFKKVTDPVHDKYITTPEFNKLTAESFPARQTLIINYQALIKELTRTKQNIYQLKINLKITYI